MKGGNLVSFLLAKLFVSHLQLEVRGYELTGYKLLEFIVYADCVGSDRSPLGVPGL